MEFSEAQALADLRWLLDCPPLLQSPQSFVFEEDASAITDWSAVKRFLETPAAYRVGYYVESLFQVWLESQPSVSELRHGIQVRREKETLGELDFLFRREGRMHHLEVALKFYLCDPVGGTRGSHFPGPNATDNFERKRDRLLGRQLPFGRAHFPEIEVSRHAVKGMIFYHENDDRTVALPAALSPDHARGLWLRARELGEYLARLPAGWSGRILRKPFWLSATGADMSAAEIAAAASEHFARWEGPVFLALCENGREVSRVFVMPDSWPAKR